MLTTHPYNFNALCHRMASLWQPCMGMAVEELGNRLLLFHFYHNLYLRWVLDNGTWLFDRHLLVLRELSTGMDPTTTPMHLADFWLQIHKLAPNFFTETVIRGLGNFVAKFVCYDVERNVYRSSSSYLRVQVTLDTTKPLPRGKKIGHPGQPSFMCEFKNEKLPLFCFICDRMGHIDRLCSIQFQNEGIKPPRLWSDAIRAVPNGAKTLGGEAWLVNTVTTSDTETAITTVQPHPQQLLPPNLQVFQHNYAAHLYSPAPNNEADTRLQELEPEALALQEEERKRRRTAHIHPCDAEMTEVEHNVESPPKLLNGIQGRQKKLAPASLQDRFCPSE
ncbi:hypothetical protein LINGRAHAP2_LOCUS2007 [Linum grandiflorum]